MLYWRFLCRGLSVYADDIVLIAPSANANRKMLRFCEQYALEYNIMFNANKSKCMFFSRKRYIGYLHVQRPPFYINNITLQSNMYISGLILDISSDMDDKNDFNRGRSALISQINNVRLVFLW